MNLENSSEPYIFFMRSFTALTEKFFSTSVLTDAPRFLAAQPRWVSSICPMFILDGTPSGLSTMSTGVPSAR